jgi:hypothetical protein
LRSPLSSVHPSGPSEGQGGAKNNFCAHAKKGPQTRLVLGGLPRPCAPCGASPPVSGRDKDHGRASKASQIDWSSCRIRSASKDKQMRTRSRDHAFCAAHGTGGDAPQGAHGPMFGERTAPRLKCRLALPSRLGGAFKPHLRDANGSLRASCTPFLDDKRGGHTNLQSNYRRMVSYNVLMYIY